MYKIEVKDEWGSVTDEFERTDLEEVRELIIELIKEGKGSPDQITVYQEVKFSCDVTVEF